MRGDTRARSVRLCVLKAALPVRAIKTPLGFLASDQYASEPESTPSSMAEEVLRAEEEEEGESGIL